MSNGKKKSTWKTFGKKVEEKGGRNLKSTEVRKGSTEGPNKY